MPSHLRIDLNADLGESEDTKRDEELLQAVSSVSLACGVHAGGPRIIARLSSIAHSKGVGVGAHPGLEADRRPAAVAPAEAAEALRAQLKLWKEASRAPLQHVKLHGTLYHAAAWEPDVARSVVAAARQLAVPILLAPAGSPLLREARRAGLVAASEGFLDRGYLPDGRLVPRGRVGDLIRDPEQAAARAVKIALEKTARAFDGSPFPLEADTLCVHADSPGALELVRAARRALEEAGVRIVPLGGD